VTVTSIDDPASATRTGRAETPRVIAGPGAGAFTVLAVAEGVAEQVSFGLEVVAGAATG